LDATAGGRRHRSNRRSVLCVTAGVLPVLPPHLL